jgi:hypothetical protein
MVSCDPDAVTEIVAPFYSSFVVDIPGKRPPASMPQCGCGVRFCDRAASIEHAPQRWVTIVANVPDIRRT